MSTAGGARVRLATDRYDLIAPLLDGRVRPARVEIDLEVEGQAPESQAVDGRSAQDRRNDALVAGELDGAETGFIPYLIMRDQGLPVVGLPIFLRRMFGHRFWSINAGSGISHPRELAGRRVGILRYQNTLAVWARGFLQDEYGIRPEQVRWVIKAAGATVDAPAPAGVPVERADGPLVDMLLAGDINALMIPHTIPPIDAVDPRVRRLFPDFKRAEQEYFRRTGDFPIMHCIALRRDLVDRSPGTAAAIWRALDAAKRCTYADLATPPRVSLAWAQAAWEEQCTALGPDPWAFGLAANLPAIERLIRYAHEQGLISRRFRPEAVFYEPPGVLG